MPKATSPILGRWKRARGRTRSASSCFRHPTDSSGGGSRRRRRRLRLAADRAVPVFLGIAKALAHGDGAKAVAKERLEHVPRQVVDGLVDGVVLDLEPLGVGRVLALDGIVPNLLGRLDEVGRVVEVALGVQVEVGDVVAEVVEPRVRRGVAGRVRRPHVRGEVAQDVGNGNLVVDHLVAELGLAERRETLVRPRVAGYLVAFADHAADQVGPRRRRVVDGAFA